MPERLYGCKHAIDASHTHQGLVKRLTTHQSTGVILARIADYSGYIDPGQRKSNCGHACKA